MRRCSRTILSHDFVIFHHFQGFTKGWFPKASEQLPCRSAEVKFFSVFLCQNCREIWREILVKFSVLRFPGFGCATENFTKISRRKRCEKRKISCKFYPAGAQRWKRVVFPNDPPVLKLPRRVKSVRRQNSLRRLQNAMERFQKYYHWAL